MPPKIDLTGKKFGRLTVLEEAGRNKHGAVTWKCKCDCKERKEIIVPSNSLKTGNTNSCGCLQKEKTKEAATKHGQCTKGQGRTSVYKVWQSMVNRCHNPNHKHYDYYGGRGIRVCDRWRNFENFYEDFGKYKSKGKSIDRIDNNRSYEPGNCRWVAWKKQMENTRSKGYHGRKDTSKYYASIMVDYQDIYLGSFDTPEEARQAYIEAKWKYHGVWLEE